MTTRNLPQLILIFLSVDWPLFSRRPMLTALAAKAAEQGSAVVAINRPLCPVSTVVRKRSRVPELLSRSRLETVAPNLHLYSPKYMLHDSLARRAAPITAANVLALQRSLGALKRRLGVHEPAPVVWYYNPQQAYVTQIYRQSFNVWELYDELVTIAGRMPAGVLDDERRYRERVHLLLATSPKLLATYGSPYPQAHLIDNGLARGTWEQLQRSDLEPLAALAAIPHPRVGFAGVISERLEWKLLLELGQRRPDWQFVFAGRIARPEFAVRLGSRKNFHYLGELSLEQLPSLLIGLDVSIMPYRDNRFFAALNPLKIYEAAAAGLHSVSSPIEMLHGFPRTVVTVCRMEVDDWLTAIEAALVRDDKVEREQRRRFSGRFLWDDIAARTLARIAELRSAGHRQP